MFAAARRRALAVLCLLTATAAGAGEPPRSETYAGTWVMKLDDRNFIVLTLRT